MSGLMKRQEASRSLNCQAFGRMGRGYMLAKPYTRHTKPCMVQGGGGPNGGMDATCIPLNNNASMGQEQRHTHTLLGMHS
eukprot:scaffold241499_cov22-Tisochrysis_lutea.AAC.1